MNVVRQRKAQGTRIALALNSRYRALVEAVGQDEIQHASIQLGMLFNENIEFIINVMRDWSGLEAKFEPMTKSTLPSTPKILTGQEN